MNWRNAFRLSFVTMLVCACHEKHDGRLEEFVAESLLRNQPTQPLYLADTDLRVTVPSNVAITKNRYRDEWTTQSIVYALKRDDHGLGALHLSASSTSGHSLANKSAKRVSVGAWPGFWTARNNNGSFSGELLVAVPRKNWIVRTLDSVRDRLLILRGKDVGIMW
jgi:hypothetical protein